MSTEKPLISFIVTVYNLEKYIGKCLDSILNQNFDDFEIVVVDNASTDSSAAICQSYAEKNPGKVRFYQVEKEMAVMGSAHYRGYEVTHGEYIQFIDGDDRLKENCLAEIAEIILSKNVDVVMGKFECYLEDGSSNKNNFNDAKFEAEKINDVTYEEALVYLSILPNFQGVFWRYIFKKSLFQKNYKQVSEIFYYPFYSTLYSDGIMLIKLFLKANSIFFLDKVIYVYTRRTDGSGIGFLGSKNLSKDSIISLLNVLYYLISLKPQGGKKLYLLNKIYFIFKFYKFGLNYIEEEQYSEIAEILKENIELLDGLYESSIEDLELFYGCIAEKGCYDGIMQYTKLIQTEFFDQLENKNSEKIYILPGGNKTISTIKLLKDNGHEVAAILDNDPQKNGHDFAGTPCFLPSVLKEYDDQRRESITFIISAMDETLTDILKKQLNGLGIDDSQIIVKE